MPGKNKKEFQLSPQLEKFKQEVAQEIGIADKISKINKEQVEKFEQRGHK